MSTSVLALALALTLALPAAARGDSADQHLTAAAVSLPDILRQVAPPPQDGTLALTLGTGEDDAYLPDLRGQVRHAEGAPVPLNSSVGLDAKTLSLELRQPLYRSGESRARTQASDSRNRALLAQKLDEQQTKALLIINAYIDTLKAQDQGAHTDARARLTSLAGVAAQTTLAPVHASPLLPATLQATLALAEEKNPAIVRAHAEYAAAEASSRSLQWQDAPDIDLRGGLDRTTDSYTDAGSADIGIIGLRATIPLRGDDERKSRRVQAHDVSESSRLKIDTTRFEIRQKVIKSWDDLSRARAEEAFQSRKASLARAALEGSLPQDSRLSQLGDSPAFARLAQQAEAAARDAHYAALKAEFALLAATGQLYQAFTRESMPLARDQRAVFNLQNDHALSNPPTK